MSEQNLGNSNNEAEAVAAPVDHIDRELAFLESSNSAADGNANNEPNEGEANQEPAKEPEAKPEENPKLARMHAKLSQQDASLVKYQQRIAELEAAVGQSTDYKERLKANPVDFLNESGIDVYDLLLNKDDEKESSETNEDKYLKQLEELKASQAEIRKQIENDKNSSVLNQHKQQVNQAFADNRDSYKNLEYSMKFEGVNVMDEIIKAQASYAVETGKLLDYKQLLDIAEEETTLRLMKQDEYRGVSRQQQQAQQKSESTENRTLSNQMANSSAGIAREKTAEEQMQEWVALEREILGK